MDTIPVNMIVAMSADRKIGKTSTNDLPWTKSQEDMDHFKKITIGSTVVMGRKTFESIGKPLPQRRNIVISKTMVGKDIYPSLVDACQSARKMGRNIFIIGGKQIYEEALSSPMIVVNIIYMTQIQGKYPDADISFPVFEDKYVLESS